MKILWLSHLVPYPPKGGVLQRSHNLLKELAKYHEVYLLSFIQSKMLKSMFPSLEAGLEEAEAELRKFCKDVKFLPIPCELTPNGKRNLALSSLFSTKPYTINWLKSDLMMQATKQWQSQYTFDAIHADTISLVPFAEIFSGPKKVLNHHNIESHMMLRRASNEKSLLKRIYFSIEGHKLTRYEKQYCANYDLNITCSTLDIERLHAVDPSLNVIDVPNGVDLDFFTPDRSQVQAGSLIFAGGLDWYPNLAAMRFFTREIWPGLKQKRNNVVMNMVGKNPSQDLLALAEQDPQFIAHGFVDDIRTVMNRSNIYVCTIMDGGGTKLKILDALAMAFPIVAHPASCEGIDVVDGESVLYAKTGTEFIDAICRLLDSPDLQEKLSTNGRRLAEAKYGYSAIGKAYADKITTL